MDDPVYQTLVLFDTWDGQPIYVLVNGAEIRNECFCNRSIDLQHCWRTVLIIKNHGITMYIFDYMDSFLDFSKWLNYEIAKLGTLLHAEK